MMRKDQVFTSGVKVKALSQILHGHYGALDVPSWPPFADGSFPECLAFFGGLPQGKIARIIFFIFVYINARANLHAAKVFFRELAVLGKLRNAEIIRAIFGAVGEAFLLQG